ncbi:amidohydrolase [Caldilinea sp.]|jgi:5-methylthioadenosine/S-adenosylhomocysteine deaminase|uniref:amidohydrolase n=1 Tax=Caldilinea sp. TaxID=2293560 RepID=UPI001B00E51B|nr:amidohydrolase [Caldilinea sp.]MBO9394134.1 amidohydrolase [Caldilinea sp.]
MSNTLVLHNCDVLARNDDGAYVVLHNHDIFVRGNRIAAILPTQPVEQLSAEEIVAADGLLAIPGLINTHAHTPMVLFRGIAEDVSVQRWFNEFIWPVESNLTAEDVYWGMLLGLVEMIEAGVTTVADHYFFMDEAARAVSEAGTRALLGWAVFGSQGYAALDATAAFVERWQGAAGGRIRTWMAPHAPYTCDDDFLRAAAAHAKRLNVGIHIHAAEDLTQTQSSLARRGITPIQVLEQTGVLDVPTLIAHGCGILPEDIELLRNYADRVGVAHCPKTYLKLAAGLTPIRPLQDAGVAIGLGSDGAASNNTLDIWESLRLMALMQKFTANDPEVMPLHAALDVAFLGSAAAIGMAGELGRLAPGFLADIVLLDLSGAHNQPVHNVAAALLYSVRASDVRTVIVDGRVVMEDRKLRTLDKTEILAQVSHNMGRLAQRVPERRIQVYNP